MRTIRGLQITSLVVLSPVLLCMVSLVSILFSSIFGWIFPTIQQQSFPAKPTTYQRNSSISTVFKKLQFVFRLQQSSVTLVILFLYLFYILFKKKRNKEQQQVVANHDILLEENTTLTKKRKNSKRRKFKKTSKSNTTFENHHHHHHVHSKPITTILHNKIQHKEQQPNDDTTSQDNWIHVTHHKDKDDRTHQQQKEPEQYQDTTNEQQPQQQKYQDTCEHYYNDTDYDEIWNINQINMEDDDWYDERQMHVDCTNDNKPNSQEHTPELTPIESEDEDHHNNKQFKNWYSPFSTGLDLDILPKHMSPQLDPLTLKYDTALPVISHVYAPKRPPSIEILENYPYIPTTSHHHTSFTQHLFGPIGDKKK